MKKKTNESSLFYIEAGIDLEGRKIMLDEDIEEGSVGWVIRALHKIAETGNTDTIHLFINSFGGSIYDGLALYDTIKIIQGNGVNINTYALGKICSMGLIIYMSGNERIAYPRASFMHHQASTDLGQNDIESMKNNLKEVERIDKICNDIVVENSHKSRKFWEEQIKGKEFWFDSKTALKLGVVTKIIGE
jgi:ATP-dependent Clp protease, protease subunit